MGSEGTMFEKILIANRGEIACRIIRSCRAHGIHTVAVYSEADSRALHRTMADEAYLIGPAPARESYLAIERIVEVCRRSGAQAVHPGYGFLAESPQFAEALAAAGIVFIGPPAQVIRRMGDKIESKRLAAEAGVPVIPGHAEALSDPGEAVAVAHEIGFPVMIKAAAGGGGKGMRVARNEAELREGLKRAQSEAASSFGDDRVFLERFIEEPRHIEIQILADRHGHVVHLGERECSIQRRHQKVIEEAPSPFLDEAAREAIGRQAVALAERVGYESAGTVEFILDARRNFYFLEMNTRLQVEHPVTELVTGRDLVWDMIRIAAGEPLGFAQNQVRLQGWAVEARVYAEDPTRGFLPSTGRLVRYRPPEGRGLRLDSGVYEGAEIPLHYDPMMAKLCAVGRNREEALERLAPALDRFVIRGPAHNLSFLRAVVDEPRFREGRISTHFIAETYGERFEGATLDEERLRRLAAVAALMAYRLERRCFAISGRLEGERVEPERRWHVSLGGSLHHAEILREEAAALVALDGRSYEIVLDWTPGRLVGEAHFGDHALVFQAEPLAEGFRVRHAGADLQVRVRSHRAASLAERMPEKPPRDTSREVLAPMPGLILSVAVRVGEPVKSGQELLILEAMKMENVLRAERDGVVAEVLVEAGESVTADQLLIRFE